jgi:hypothetical protein
MRKHFYFFFAIYIVSAFGPASAQKLINNTSVTGVSYAGNKINRIYIPPPVKFFRKSDLQDKASVKLLYTGFPSTAANALQYAASILETVLPSGTKVTLSASWELITTRGVLANSSITGFVYGWAVNAIDPKLVYPVALAEKIGGESLNDSLDGDITLRINSSVNWYYGTDGNTPSTKYDLVTVILHEVCHGLGFYDSFSTSGTIGWYGFGSYPIIYDTFLENASGKRLTDNLSFTNYSAGLKTELTGGNVYFNGPLLKNAMSGGRIKIYAPGTWDSGSSISHIDETTAPDGSLLMTPFINFGEAIHDPGKLIMSMLGDLGWVNTRIIHELTRDTESRLTSLPVNITVKSDTAYNHNRVCLVWSADNFATSDTVFMVSGNADDNYSANIPVNSFNSRLQYYFFTEDCFNRLYRCPSYIDSIKYSVFIGTDTIKPVIDHTPLVSLLETVDTIDFTATVTDNLGVDTVYIEYSINEEPAHYLGLAKSSGNVYNARLNARQLHLAGGDSINYRIFAADSAKVPNIGILPASGTFSVRIDGLANVLEKYSTDFTGDAAADFINDGFTVMQPSGFTHYGLNSLHPYESPEDNNKSINYTSVLSHPLKLKESGLMISYKEIVLVEPGEEGAAFGSSDFYDYVIAEGSKNSGKTWFSLADGYDSQLHTAWETAYNSSSDGTNSTAIGSESLLFSHNILCSPSDKISAGDTLLLRFRLYSDPFAHGWGWTIEDLDIRPFTDDVTKISDENDWSIYPNPGNGIIRLRSGEDLTNTSKTLHYSILDASGICIKSDILPGQSENVIDFSGHPSGIYFIILTRDDWLKTIRYCLIR